MTKASDMDPEERKRQYSALRRAIYRDATPALVAKFSVANDADRFLKIELITLWGSVFSRWKCYRPIPNIAKPIATLIPLYPTCLFAVELRFGMLRQWMQNPDLSSITVEEKYYTFVENLRTDRYVTAIALLDVNLQIITTSHLVLIVHF